MHITVYTRRDCAPCAATKRFLTRRGAEFDVVDVDEDPTAREAVATWGFRSAPVVHVAGLGTEYEDALAPLAGVFVEGTGARWSGYRPDALTIVAPKESARG